ncbi:metallophosphoesterase [Sphingobacterium thalpophilum]
MQVINTMVNRSINISGYLSTDPFRISALYPLLFILLSFQPWNLRAQFQLGRHDGPYFFYENGKTVWICVADGIIKRDTTVGTFSVSTEDGRHRFTVSRHPLVSPAPATYRRSDKLMVLSDPHGDFESFHSILKSQQVIGSNYEWTFGKNHLVIIGDVFDRGQDVLPIFWLIYKLEDEAAKAGGRVYFLLGNHEEMLLRGNYKYTQGKYMTLADNIGRKYRDFWTSNTELGQWLQSKNTIEKVGKYLFVHAGLSAAMLNPKWTIDAINDSVRHHLFRTKAERQRSAAAEFLFGSEGPLWYRGMVKQEEKYQPLSATDLKKILKKYAVERIFVGHTIFDEVSSFYEGKVYGVNVRNEANRLKGSSRGLLIADGKLILVYDDATKNKVINK